MEKWLLHKLQNEQLWHSFNTTSVLLQKRLPSISTMSYKTAQLIFRFGFDAFDEIEDSDNCTSDKQIYSR